MKQLSPKRLLAKIKKEHGYSKVEHALSLPYQHLTHLEEKLKRSEHFAAEDVALLRIINVMPWILEVAANGYKDADKILIENVLIKPEREIQERIENKGW